MREFTVIKEILNIRSRPTDESVDTFVGELKQGESVWLHEQEIIGAVPKGGQTNIWLANKDNNVVAKDGVRLRNYGDQKKDFLKDDLNKRFWDTQFPEDESKWKVSWGHVHLEVHKIWRENLMGEGVRVAVVDTGVDMQHPDLKKNFGFRIKLDVNNTAIVTDEYSDFDGHGTNCYGIIGANGNNYLGLAPLCEITMIKLYNESLPSNEKAFLLLNKLFEKIIEINSTSKRFDFISMSFSLNQTDLNGSDVITGKSWIEVLQEKISKIARETIILSSFGEGSNRYPASFKDVIAVGTYDKSENLKVIISGKAKTEFIYAPGGDNLKTTTLSSVNPPYLLNFLDSSASTAFTAGYLSLIYSKIKKDKGTSLKEFSVLLSRSLSENNRINKLNIVT